jgi:hypothetical protein
MTAPTIARWGPRHDAAVAALLVSPSVTAAAKRAGCGEKTLRRWIQTALFQDRLAVAQRESQDRALGWLQTLTMQAVVTVARSLNCGTPAVELAGARFILETGLRLRELDRVWDPSIEELDRLIARVERELAARDHDDDQVLGDGPL